MKLFNIKNREFCYIEQFNVCGWENGNETITITNVKDFEDAKNCARKATDLIDNGLVKFQGENKDFTITREELMEI